MMKRLIGVLLAVCLLFSVATVAVSALDVKESELVPQGASVDGAGSGTASFCEDAYNKLAGYLTLLDKNSLLKTLNPSDVDMQTIIDDLAKSLGLSKEDVAKAIEDAKKSGAQVSKDYDWSKLWDEARSALPKNISNIYYPSFTVKPVVKGLQISWKKTIGASRYRVYVKKSGKWKKIKDVEGTSLVDTSVKSGTAYTYTVRALTKDGKMYLSGYLESGVKCTFIAAPDFSLTNVADGVKIAWNKVKGAAKYRVFYQTEKGWVKLKDTTALTVTDTAVTSGKAYTYTVRCITSDGKSYTGAYLAGKKITFLTAPKFSLSNAKTGVKITWSKVKGAAKYRVFYKTEKGWVKLKDTTALTLTDTAVTSGKSYTYTVRCLSKDGKSYTSAYRAGKSIKFKK